MSSFNRGAAALELGLFDDPFCVADAEMGRTPADDNLGDGGAMVSGPCNVVLMKGVCCYMWSCT